jgi:hypothetical protein
MKTPFLALFVAVMACVAIPAQEQEPPIMEVKLAEPQPDIQEADQSPIPTIYGPLQKDLSRTATLRKDAVGKRVTVEGIAWGQPFGLKGQEGTISPHVLPHVIHQGGSMFVKGIDFTESKARGKPVRVSGILRLEPKTGTRFGDVAGYYYLEAEDFEPIEAVKDPYPVLAE